MRRHRLAERFLTDVLKLSWAEAHHEAGKWEHIMSENVERAMDDLLGSPTTCPLSRTRRCSLRPGCSGVITATSPDGTMTVEIDGRHVGVGAFASERIMVTA